MRANEELKRIAENRPFIQYMEAGATFLREDDGKKTIIRELMNDGLHPNEAGLLAWGPLIVDEVVQLMSEALTEESDELNSLAWANASQLVALCRNDEAFW
eukprot:CAMPEP_0116571672 /NCGR_PEP_ID=MMETSP0397-20121206/17705_1 /TAXON_ID=216820 /ORGANISM="Cyclophora tenuis, Strain ECT3854" /LENGTH=100 /DNA_ID=CAMNT_0004099825 /DNA_START=1 /DNA_END=299 /DNA_ORIENTATION=+